MARYRSAHVYENETDAYLFPLSRARLQKLARDIERSLKEVPPPSGGRKA